ncbi:membrane metallo-endopeptidase-like 1 isoform X3 [Dermacentor albipictus]|uniref:membrane metallo-endopeptidase-like 1 isoform X3 n=1 Tax=Dermacentor albipictus TaxID=60249 RepID=UPI0031FC99F5
MATGQGSAMESLGDSWSDVVDGAENAEPDAPPLAVDSNHRSQQRARRRGFRTSAQGNKPHGTGHRRPLHAMHYFSFARFAGRHSEASRRGSISSAAQLQHEGSGAMEAPLLSALFLLTSLLFLVSLLSLYYSMAFSHIRRWLKLTEEYDDCRTKFCCVFGTRVKSVRNESTNLCEDIYTPMCSTVDLTCPDGEITSEHRTWSVSEALTRRLLGLAEVLGSPEALENPASNVSALLFRSCLARGHHLSVQAGMRRLLSSVGLSSWPFRENESVDVAVALMVQLRDFAAPFVVTLSIREPVGNSRTRTISLEPPDLLLSPASWMLAVGPDEGIEEVKQHHQKAYEKYALAVFRELLPDAFSSVPLSKLATQLYVFEQALAAHIPRRSTSVEHLEAQLRLLQDSEDVAQWSGILGGVFGSLGQSTLELVPVVVFSRYYLAFLNDLLLKRSVVLANYLGWRLVEYVAWSGSTSLRNQRHHFWDSVMPFQLSTQSPELRCVAEVYHLLPESSSRLYRSAVALLPKSERILLKLTVSALKMAMTATLQGSPWVDNATQWHAVRKVQSMNVSFGHGNLPPAERLTSGESFNETDLYENLLTLARRKAQVLRATLRGEDPIASRGVNHIGVAPVYNPVRNTLYVPYGLLVIPLFTDVTPSVHFSNSGFIIAKEMLQAFLGTGQYFHDDGLKNHSWWSLFTTANFEANKQCMEYILRDKSNSSLTEEELTDLLWSGAALHIAHKAFRIFLGQYAEWLQKIAASKTLYTQSQLFFLGFVLNRCTSSLLQMPLTRKTMTERDWVNQVTQQGTNFRKAFRCPGPASCPFWRLEENDCWDDSDYAASWPPTAQTAQTADVSLIDS